MNQASQKVTSTLATILAAIAMGMLGFFVRESQISPFGCAFARFLIGFVLMTGILCFKRQRPVIKTALMPFLAGVSIALCILFYFIAIKATSIGVAVFLLYLGPFFAVIGEALLTRQMPSRTESALILVALIGLVCIWLFGEKTQDSSWYGLLFALLSGVTYGIYILFNRRTPTATPIFERTFWQFLAGTLILLPGLFFVTSAFQNVAHGWPYLLIIGVCQGFLVLLLVAYAIKHLTAIRFGTLSYIEPIVGIVAGYLIYSECLTTGQMIGCGLVLIATLAQTFLRGDK